MPAQTNNPAALGQQPSPATPPPSSSPPPSSPPSTPPNEGPRIVSQNVTGGGNLPLEPINKGLIFGVVAVILVSAVSAFLIFKFLPDKKPEEEVSRELENPFEQATNPFAVQAANPFEEESTFVNPFALLREGEEYKNPFEELR